ncbi:MAG: metallophosphoesterase [Bacteroidetes bacterium]|nr:metallophosphoesterase [Bacteroidota bacterium]
MKPRHILILFWIMAIGSQLILQQSCKKKEITNEYPHLTVNLSMSVMQNESYYSLNYQERSVEMEFSEPIDSSTIKSNISFSDKNGSLDSWCTTIACGRKVIIAFLPGFQLHDGWKYLITIKTGLSSTAGTTLQATTTIEVRTTARHLVLDSDTSKRNSIICISDIHMGDPRSVALGYCWFSKNAAALENLLDTVLTCPQMRQLVILGDLFDEWVVPYRLSPFDSGAGINNSRDYFLSIANAPVNVNIINKLKAIASSGTIQLIYVPGNHDMLLTQEVLQEIIPGVIWQGDSTGLGHYSPLSEIIMEHGHRYDFFNCPQPLSNPGHILPPGYFISRLDAEGLMEQGSHKYKEPKTGTDQVEFLTAWTAAFGYLQLHYSLIVAADSANVGMGGIDNYPTPLSFNGVRDMYAGNIETVWPSTEIRNAVPVAMPVLMAILDGSLDLSFTAAYEYMQSQAPKIYKIVAFGHTHDPMLKVYPPGNQYTGIYANTGSWVNAELCKKPVRTFLVIKPSEWTGSELDVVSLFQYNLDSGGGEPNPGFVPVLISEESIERGK